MNKYTSQKLYSPRRSRNIIIITTCVVCFAGSIFFFFFFFGWKTVSQLLFFFPFSFLKPLGKVALRRMEEPARTQTDTLTSCFVSSFLPNRMDEDSRRFFGTEGSVQSFDSITQQLTRAERAGSTFSSNLLLYP